MKELSKENIEALSKKEEPLTWNRMEYVGYDYITADTSLMMEAMDAPQLADLYNKFTKYVIAVDPYKPNEEVPNGNIPE